MKELKFRMEPGQIKHNQKCICNTNIQYYNKAYVGKEREIIFFYRGDTGG